MTLYRISIIKYIEESVHSVKDYVLKKYCDTNILHICIQTSELFDPSIPIIHFSALASVSDVLTVTTIKYSVAVSIIFHPELQVLAKITYMHTGVEWHLKATLKNLNMAL